MPVMSHSWKASVPIRCERTWPVMQTSGVESIQASAIGVTRFVAPGPGRRDRDADPPGRARVALAPCGRRPARGGRARAARSCRARSRRRSAGSRRPGCRTSTSTPSASSERRIASAPFIFTADPQRELRVAAGAAAAARARRRRTPGSSPRRPAAADVRGRRDAAERCREASSSASTGRAPPSPSESISAVASSIRLGLATPCPARSLAVPCAGPKRPGPSARASRRRRAGGGRRARGAAASGVAEHALGDEHAGRPGGQAVERLGERDVLHARRPDGGRRPGRPEQSTPRTRRRRSAGPRGCGRWRMRARASSRRPRRGAGRTSIASPVSSSTRVTRAPRSSAAFSALERRGGESPATSTASALEVAWRVTAGRRWPERVSASVSNGGCSSSTRSRARGPRPASARLAAAVISGPIPWPARHATTYVRRPVIGGDGLSRE